jgi:MOSC domain-containing protein YiiM
MKMGKIDIINVSAGKGKKQPANDMVRFVVDHGIENDYHAGRMHLRQVSLLAKNDIDGMRAKGLTIDDGDFGENIVCSDLDLDSAGLGTVLEAGKEVVLEISKIGKECHTPCIIYHTVGDCIMPRKGIFCRVVKGGDLGTGDSISIKKKVIRTVKEKAAA